MDRHRPDHGGEEERVGEGVEPEERPPLGAAPKASASDWWRWAAATAASLALRPARRFRVTPAGLAEAGRFAVFFGRASLLGAVDVARRAFRRHVHLDPHFVRADLDVRGAEAALVALVVSLLPGTVAVALGDGWIRIHVLDRSIPATRHLAEVEERVLRLTASFTRAAGPRAALSSTTGRG